MNRAMIALVALAVGVTYVGTPLKAEDTSQPSDTAKEQLYVRVFYCFDTQSVLKQRKSEKHKIIAGYALSSLDPNSDEVKTCVKDGVLMTGYVQISPPFVSPDEGDSSQK